MHCYITKSNTPRWLFLVFLNNFQTVLSSTCFSHEFLVHINENVSFQHVAFLHLIRYGIYTVNVPIKPTFTFAIMKKDCIFFLSFILYLNIAKFYVYITQSFQLQTFLFFNPFFFLFNSLMSFSKLLELLVLELFWYTVNTL